ARRGIEVLFRAGRRGLVETKEAELVLHGLRVLQNPSDAVTREKILASCAPDSDINVNDVSVEEFFRTVARLSPESICTLFAEAARSVDLTQLMRSLLDALREMRGTHSPSEDPDKDWRVMLSGDLDNRESRWKEYSGHVAPEARSLGGLLGEL